MHIIQSIRDNNTMKCGSLDCGYINMFEMNENVYNSRNK